MQPQDRRGDGRRRRSTTLNELALPLAREVEAAPGEIQPLTPSIDALYMPNIDDALDEEAAKRAFWTRVPRARRLVRGLPALLASLSAARADGRNRPWTSRSARSRPVGEHCEECGAKLTDARAGAGARSPAAPPCARSTPSRWPSSTTPSSTTAAPTSRLTRSAQRRSCRACRRPGSARRPRRPRRAGSVAATGTLRSPEAKPGSTALSTSRAAAALSSSERARSVEPWMRPRLPISARRLSSALAPAPTPITQIRPRVGERVEVAGQVRARRPARGSRRTGPCVLEARRARSR